MTHVPPVEKLTGSPLTNCKARLPVHHRLGDHCAGTDRSTMTPFSRLSLTSSGRTVPPSLADEGLGSFRGASNSHRGQRGNRWESTAGKGLWFSVLLRPGIRSATRDGSRFRAIEAISDVIRIELGLEPAIKLPNDVQLNGHKVAGVLVEMRAQESAASGRGGIGINVDQCRAVIFPPNFRQTPYLSQWR